MQATSSIDVNYQEMEDDVLNLAGQRHCRIAAPVRVSFDTDTPRRCGIKQRGVRSKRITADQNGLKQDLQPREEHWRPCHLIVSSPAPSRTLTTAKAVNRTLNCQYRQTQLLRELDWGEWTGKRLKEIKGEHPGRLKTRMEQEGWRFPPGGEDRRAAWLRSRDALVAAFKRWPGETILTVTHEGVIKCLLYGLTDRKYLPQRRGPAMMAPRHLRWLAAGRRVRQLKR